MRESVFELKDVRYSYLGRYPALAGLDLKVPKGEKIALLGANGTGKSTLLQLLDGLIFPDSGKVYFRGEEVTEEKLNDEAFSRGFRRKVGFVFQNPDIQLFCPTVREDISFGPLQFGVSQKELAARMDVVAGFLGIGHLLERSCHQLSIGEKRKVAIATVLVMEPEVLLLDEPTAGLDPATTQHVIEMIEDASNSGKTVITATHDLHVVGEMADTLFVFNAEKRIIRSGATQEILQDTAFLQQHNLMHVHRHHHHGTVHTHPHQHLEHHHEEP
jgi:cobalt/nickel transport system ATP-binding protein